MYKFWLISLRQLHDPGARVLLLNIKDEVPLIHDISELWIKIKNNASISIKNSCYLEFERKKKILDSNFHAKIYLTVGLISLIEKRFQFITFVILSYKASNEIALKPYLTYKRTWKNHNMHLFHEAVDRTYRQNFHLFSCQWRILVKIFLL